MTRLHNLWTTPRGWLWLAVMVVIAFQTAFWIPATRTRGFATGDGGVKLWQVQGIVRTGDLSAPLDYPGEVYDPEHKYAPFVEPWAFWYNGKAYTEYTSPFIWASVPLFLLLDHTGLLILPWLGGALLVIMSAWLAWRVRPDRSAVLVPLIVGFSSPLLVYSLEFWEHAPGTALAILALVGVVKALNSRRRAIWLMVAGAAIGLGLTMRAELYVYPIAILVGLLVMRSVAPLIRSIGWLAAGGLIIAGPWWLYQSITWGSPFGPRLQQNVPALGGTEMLARLGNTTGRNWSMLWPAEGEGLTVLAVSVLLVAIMVLLVWVLQHKISWIVKVGFWIRAVLLIAISVMILWRLSQGLRPDDLLATFPIVLLLLLLVPYTGQRPAADRQTAAIIRFLIVVPVAFVLLVLLVSPFHGGIQWGPRFLLPIIPPLTVVIVDRLARSWSGTSRSMQVGLAAASIALLAAGTYSTWQGMQFMRRSQISSEFMAEVIRQSPERVVVADAWFLPQNAPYTFTDKIWFLSEDDKQIFSLLQRLRKQTNEPGFIYTSALTWAHIDPQPIMGPRIAPVEGFEKVHVNAPTQYIEISRYLLLK